MKKYLMFFFLLITVLILPTPVSAHLVGQPPYFRINGVYSNLYPVPSTSLSDFNLPQDLAADNYLVGQSLKFTMETDKLPVAPEVVQRTKFDWDFGDGSKGTGLGNTHVYNKMGSYFLTIYATVDTDQPQIIQSVLLNVLPNKNYQLPQALIKVNGMQAKDPLTDVIHLKFGDQFSFDGSGSTAASAKIASYFWDFGDQQSSTNVKATHSYDSNLGQVFPLLRIKDSNGFISDSFIEIENSAFTTQEKPVINNNKQPSNQPVDKSKIIIGVVIILATLLGIWWLKLRRK